MVWQSPLAASVLVLTFTVLAQPVNGQALVLNAAPRKEASLLELANKWKLNSTQAAAIGRPDGVGKIRICISPYTPYVFCERGKPQSSYSGYQVAVFYALAQRVEWLADFNSWFFDCLAWSPLMADLAADNGTCLLAPTGVIPNQQLLDSGVAISWIMDKEGMRILTVPRNDDASLWAPLTVFSVPLWLLLVGTSASVGVILWVFDTRARSLLKSTPRRHARTQQPQPGGPRRSFRGLLGKVMPPRHARANGAAAGAGGGRKLQAGDFGPLERAGAPASDGGSFSSGSCYTDARSTASSAAHAACPTCGRCGREALAPQQLNGKGVGGGFGVGGDSEDGGWRRGPPEVARGALGWLGVKRGEEEGALKSLKDNVLESLLRLPDIGDAPSVSTLPARVVLFAYGLLLLIILALYTANSAAQLTARLNSDIRSLDDLRGKSVATWTDFVDKLKALGVAAVGMPWEDAQDEAVLLDMVRSGQVKALVLSTSFVEFTESQQCEFAAVGDQFAVTDYGAGYHKNMPEALRQSMDRAIAAAIEDSVPEKLYDVNVKQQGGKCQDQLRAAAEMAQVTVKQVAGLWVLLGLSVGLGACVLMLYWLRHHLKRAPAFNEEAAAAAAPAGGIRGRAPLEGLDLARAV